MPPTCDLISAKPARGHRILDVWLIMSVSASGEPRISDYWDM